MKKKDAIERLAVELEARDQRAFERATEAAGNAASVIQVVKDYKALAKEHMDRAVMQLAYERALANLDRPSVLQEKAVPLLHTYTVGTEFGTYSFRLGPNPLPKGVCIPDMLRQGWTDAMLRNEGYIL